MRRRQHPGRLLLAALGVMSVALTAAPAFGRTPAAPSLGALSLGARSLGARSVGPAPGGGPAPSLERGAYEWDDATWWPTPTAYEATLATLQNLGVTTLYVDITAAVTMLHSHSSALTPFLADFAQLVEEADADGLRVDAVGGDPTWATTDRSGPASLLSAVALVTAALPPGALEGVQFDVEPWGLRAWRTHKGVYAKDWLRFLQSTVTTWNSDGLSGRLGFTVPYWFDGATGGVPRVSFGGATGYPFQLALGILAPLAASAMNVMAYRNQTAGPNGSVALFASNLQAVVAADSPTRLLTGQETGAATPAEITFYGTSCDAFETAATQITDAFDGDTQFAGIAVDDVESLEALCPQ